MDFHSVDWLILIVSLILVFYFGLQSRRYVRTSGDFLVAGRRMGVHLGTISLVSTEIGLVTYMYYAEMGFLYGFTAIISGLITAGAYYFLGTTGFVIRKVRELELVTISQFFQQRYNHRVRILAGILMAIGGALNFGVFPVIEATFLNIVTGIPREHILWTMMTLIFLVLLYTAAGGMISVLVTNYIQYVVLVFGMITITVYCLVEVGLPAMVSTVQNQIGESGFNPLIHPSFGWEFILWQILAWLAALTAWAPVAVRAFSSESPEVSKRIFRWTSFLFLSRAILPMLWGIAALAYFTDHELVALESAPLLVREIIPVGMKGVVVAGMLAASMSTYSGYLLAFSSVISEDVIIPLLKRPLSQRGELLLNKLTVLGLAAFIIVWGLFYVVPSATFFYLQVTANIFLAGTFWSLVAGLYWKKAHSLGAYCSLIFGASVISIYFFIPNPEQWSGAIGMASYFLAFLGMVIGSLIGEHVPSRKMRLALMTCVVVIIVMGTSIFFLLPQQEVWISFWMLVVGGSALIFVLLSGIIVVKGFPELKTVLNRTPGIDDPEKRSHRQAAAKRRQTHEE